MPVPYSRSDAQTRPSVRSKPFCTTFAIICSKPDPPVSPLPLSSRNGAFVRIGCLAFAALFGFFSYKMIPFARHYEHLVFYIPTVAFILLTIICLLAPWLYYRVIIYPDHVEFTQLGVLKRYVKRTDLLSYEIFKRRTKYKSWEVLRLYTRRGQYTIDSQMYVNFGEVVRELIIDLPMNNIRARKRERLPGRRRSY